MLTHGASQTLDLAILTAIDDFQGFFFDLDNNCRIDAVGFASGWADLARQLGRQGMSEQHRVVLAVHTGPLFPAALAAVLLRGATPLLVHGASPLPELLRYARRIGASWLLRDPVSLLSERGDLGGPVLIMAGSELDKSFASIACYQLDDPDAGAAPVQSFRSAPLHLTSGSTGESKIAARPGFCCLEEARHIMERIDVTCRDRFFTCVPMSHAYGYGTGTMTPILAHAAIITQRRFNPRTAVRALSSQEITILPSVPAMLDLMLKVGDWPTQPPRVVLSAGSPLSEQVAGQLQDRHKIRARPLYGSTESGTISIDVSPQPYQRGCVGEPLHDVQVRLTPLEGCDSGAAEIGQLQVRSSSMMSGYLLDGHNELAAAPDEWFDTGDLAKIDSDGAIHLVGRAKEIIDVGGLKVIPGDVEQVLASIEGVVEVAVYAGKHRSGSDIVKAALVASKPIDARDLRAHCERQLVAYKCPEIVTFVAKLPRSAAGKILRSELP